MKKVLLLMVAVLMISSVAMADHLGIYADTQGTSCALGAPGFYNLNAHVMHKFSAGTTGSRFKITVPVGSMIFAFNSPFLASGIPTSDESVGYGGCQTGSFVIGSLVAQLTAGQLKIEVADLQPFLMHTDCTFTELPIHGGAAYVGTTGDCEEPLATQQSTWGKVKSLYK
jgi:hypothetical protein